MEIGYKQRNAVLDAPMFMQQPSHRQKIKKIYYVVLGILVYLFTLFYIRVPLFICKNLDQRIISTVPVHSSPFGKVTALVGVRGSHFLLITLHVATASGRSLLVNAGLYIVYKTYYNLFIV